ncbi:MAG: TonB-dependent receptor [Bacteroidaceae bacterium]|nr:TonB-dependent receptor [Bacteroidaceae bacterium]
MKRRTLLGCLIAAALPSALCAQEAESDSLHTNLQEVEIMSIRATKTTPVAYTNIGREELNKGNTGVDLPYLVSMTPSAVATSDAGAGIGYTSLRIRGTDGTRINVTANGIPVNDAESHTVFWVNLPDLASSVNDIQIQRGVGTSTNGAGAFGASINMQTSAFNTQPYAGFSGSAGSFGTHKETLRAGTGIIRDHWAVDLRLSDIGSDGYIDRASTNLQSYYLQGAYYGNNTSVRLITFAGEEETYHAWNYASKEEMQQYGRRYNSCGYMYTDADGKAHYYDNQTDNYRQQNYQLLVDHHFDNRWSLNAGAHYTKGDGYYQEYKSGRKLVEYALQPFTVDGSEVKKSDLVRKKAMDNHFGGAVFSLNYKDDRLSASLGGAANRYFGKHFGKVLWVKEYIGELTPDHEYYRNNGAKNDANIYLKGDYRIADGLNLYADMQYRYIRYKIDGHNDKWNDATGALQQLAIDEEFSFFNPKAGLSWQIDRNNRLFASVAVAHKEPTRNNYTDGKLHERPTAERLIDYELGYTFGNRWLHAGANIYFMDYKDQLVLTGELNEIGEPLAANIPRSYRAGIELMAGITLPCGFRWDANATFSRNRIKEFTEVLYDDDTYERWEINHGETRLSFSPDIIASNTFAYSWHGLEASLQSQYVGKQYMSNSDQEEHRLDAYFVSNLRLAYTFKLPHTKSITAGVTIYNLFDEEYENNGYAGSGYYTDADGTRHRYNYAGYAAQAGIHFMGHVNIEL